METVKSRATVLAMLAAVLVVAAVAAVPVLGDVLESLPSLDWTKHAGESHAAEVWNVSSILPLISASACHPIVLHECPAVDQRKVICPVPGTQLWVSASAGRSGLTINYVILKHSARVELYIDVDRERGEGNKAMFDGLASQKREIEEEFGTPLNWERLDNSRACRISALVERGGWLDEAQWPEIQDALIDTMIRFDQALRPRWEKL